MGCQCLTAGKRLFAIPNTCLHSKVQRSTSAKVITTSLRRSAGSKRALRRCCDQSRFGGHMSTRLCWRKARRRSMALIRALMSKLPMDWDGSCIFNLAERTGRIVHLEPLKWQDGWPVIGEVPPGGSIGEPVAQYPELPVD